MLGTAQCPGLRMCFSSRSPKLKEHKVQSERQTNEQTVSKVKFVLQYWI